MVNALDAIEKPARELADVLAARKAAAARARLAIEPDAVTAWAELLTDGPITPEIRAMAADRAATHGHPFHLPTEDESMRRHRTDPTSLLERMTREAKHLMRDGRDITQADLRQAGFTDAQIAAHGTAAIARAATALGADRLDRAA